MITLFARQFIAHRDGTAQRKAEKRAASSDPEQAEIGKKELAAIAERNADPDPRAKGITVLEALAATGLRSIRYFNEIPEVRSIICNDMSEDAVQSIRRNVEFCGIDPATQVIPNHGDAK